MLDNNTMGKKVYIMLEEMEEDDSGTAWLKLELHGERPNLESIKEQELTNLEYWGVRMIFLVREALTHSNVIKDEEKRWKLH